MKSMKKLLAFALVLVMLTALGATAFAAQTDGKTASITITTDATYEANDANDQQYTYKAYKIFDASYNSLTGTWNQTNKDANADIAYTPTGAAVSYFMKTGNPWISTIQGLTDYFTVTPATDGYVVTAVADFDSTAEAKTLATALKNALPTGLSGDYEGIAVTANGTAVSVQPGYYLIVGDTAANLALVTTDVTIVEKNEYPHLIKEFSDEATVGVDPATGKPYDAPDEATSADDSVQIGDTISYTLTVIIPAGANQALTINDTFTTGLDPVLDGDVVKITPTGLATGTTLTSSAPASGKFTITMTADDVVKNAGKTITIVYEAVVTADAWYQTEVNTGELWYGNNYKTKPDHVDSQTFNIELDKKAGSETGDDLGGAKFQILVGGTYDSTSKKVSGATVVNLVELTDADLAKLGTTENPFVKAEKTIYYRVADKNDTSPKTEIDMTAKDGNDYKYTKAVVYGLDGDLTYYARETQAPTGYNQLDYDLQMVMGKANHVYPVVNKAGSVLPSTGGIGTTLFYVIGTILVLGAGVVLVTKRRVRE